MLNPRESPCRALGPEFPRCRRKRDKGGATRANQARTRKHLSSFARPDSRGRLSPHGFFLRGIALGNSPHIMELRSTQPHNPIVPPSNLQLLNPRESPCRAFALNSHPVAKSAARAGQPGRTSVSICRALLDQTAEGGCLHMVSSTHWAGLDFSRRPFSS